MPSLTALIEELEKRHRYNAVDLDRVSYEVDSLDIATLLDLAKLAVEAREIINGLDSFEGTYGLKACVEFIKKVDALSSAVEAKDRE